MPSVTASCQNCGAQIAIEYTRLGAPVQCEICHEHSVPQVMIGTPIPSTGYELTFRDFCQLLKFKPYRVEIAALLDEWFGYRVVECGPDTLIFNETNEAIDSFWLHRQIQCESAKQYRLYQIAMSLGR
jgi:hypothetical protein